MKLKKITESKDKLQMSLDVSGVSEAFVNTIRRMVIEEVPTLAVEDVTFKENSSALFDEILALRLGLIPIKTDLSSYSLPENPEQIAEKSAKCTLQMSLKSSKKGTVYAKEASSKDPKCTFAFPNMPIAKVLAKQKIDCDMLAVVGQGKEHIKWAPGHIWYSTNADLKINQNSKKLAEFKDKFPPQIFDASGKISEKKIRDLDLIDAVDRVCDDVVKVSYQQESFTMSVESFGQLSVKEMLQTASTMLSDKAKELATLI